MVFELDTTGASQSSGGDFDFEAYQEMNEEIIKIVGTQNKAKSVVGYISGIYDLGMQPRQDFEKLYDEDDKEQAKDLENEASGARVVTKDFYDNGKKHKQVEVFCKPRSPAKAFALAVDFPQFVVDKGVLYGESNPAPLRLIMGGDWRALDPAKDDGSKMKVINKPFYMAENTANDAKVWAISNKTTLHSMMEACELADEHGLTHKEDISKLLGKPLLFKIRVYNKPDKNDKSRVYFREEIKYVSEVPDGLPIPDFDEALLHGININRENDPGSVQQLRTIVKNTIRLSTDWEGSVLMQELAAQKDSNTATTDTTQGTTDDSQDDDDGTDVGDEGVDMSFDDDIPF